MNKTNTTGKTGKTAFFEHLKYNRYGFSAIQNETYDNAIESVE